LVSNTILIVRNDDIIVDVPSLRNLVIIISLYSGTFAELLSLFGEYRISVIIFQVIIDRKKYSLEITRERIRISEIDAIVNTLHLKSTLSRLREIR